MKLLKVGSIKCINHNFLKILEYIAVESTENEVSQFPTTPKNKDINAKADCTWEKKCLDKSRSYMFHSLLVVEEMLGLPIEIYSILPPH